MTGKTHIAAGVAAGLLCSIPQSPAELCITVGAGYLGGILCDLDINGSKARHVYAQVIGIVAAASGITIASRFFTDNPVLFQFWQQIGKTIGTQSLCGLLLLAVLCFFGTTRPHRSFMHSLPCMVLSCIAMYLILPVTVLPFAAGMLSHVLLDLLNKKKVQLLYPLKIGQVSLGLCSSHGKVNHILCLSFLAADVILAYLRISPLF
jgi:inner membrane protein